MIGMSIKRISVLNLCHVLKPFVQSTPGLFKTATRIFGPRQANLVLIAYASSEGSGEPAHPRSLARTSAARSYKQ